MLIASYLGRGPLSDSVFCCRLTAVLRNPTDVSTGSSKLSEALRESLQSLHSLSTEQRESNHSFKWVQHFRHDVAQSKHAVLGNEQAVPWQQLVVCRRGRTSRDR